MNTDTTASGHKNTEYAPEHSPPAAVDMMGVY